MKYGKLTFIGHFGTSPDKHILWKMICDCGNERIAMATRVRQGAIFQCHACATQAGAEANKKHGMRNTSEYTSWQSMKRRCLSETDKDYKKYGAKGITICKEWIDSFECFFNDMGRKPKGSSLDRIDNTKGYYKENCRWATDSQQQRNKRNSRVWLIKGKVFESLLEAANFYGVTKTTVKRWVTGSFDKRRNTFTRPKNDCKQIFKY